MQQRLQYRGDRHRRRGAAIVIVLCFLVLIAGLLVAFLSRATTERQVSNASAQGTKVELMADMALDLIVDDLRDEIITNSDAKGSGANALYIPKAAANAVPERDGSIPLLNNLIRRSSRANAKTRASALASSGKSANGRYVDLSRWNAHYLLPLANPSSLEETLPDSSFQAPDWVIVTRNGPVSSATWAPSLADSATTNGGFAIGRYAFAIYDEGGLLDINAAGYPSSSSVAQYGAKGGLAYADLRELAFTSAQADQLVGWRNFASLQPSGSFPNLAFDSAAAGRYREKVTAGLNTYLNVAQASFEGNTDRKFLNRQQLITLLKTIAANDAERVKLQAALPSLGTFSREVNAPSWGPSVDYAAPYKYKADQFNTGSTVYNPFIQSVRVKAEFTRGDGGIATVGEPLVKTRFSLETLALLEKMKGTSTLTERDKDDIARLFGLDAVTDSNGFFRHWNYPTTNSKYAHDTTGILSLNDVAGKNREPDFFELLQAGILAGSLGKGGGRGDVLNGALGYTSANFTDPDAKTTLQLLRIGANIIDQWDADNYPTTITFWPTGDNIYGIEDLPYLNKFLYAASGPGNPSVPYDSKVYRFKTAFQLWNPHQALANSGAYPTQFRITPYSNPALPEVSDSYQIGVVVNNVQNNSYPTWYWNAKNGAWTTGAYADYFTDTESGGVTTFTLSNPATQYREPAIGPEVQLHDMRGFPPDTVPKNGVTFSQLRALGGAAWIYFKTHTMFRVQYQDENGAFRTYGTFVGLDNPNAPAPGTSYHQAPWLAFSNTTVPDRWYAAPKSDPRTFRFGSAQSDNYNAENALYSITPSAALVYTKVNNLCPFIGGTGTSSNANPYRIDLWATNAGGATNNPLNPSYPDRDLQVRPGDVNGGTSPLYSAANGGPAARPVILNRPFRSVGELGYVFRDMPWKTLDLSSAKSADAGLLDLFTLRANQPVVAGRVNPNTRQRQVLAAVVAEAAKSAGGGTTVASDKALAVADAVIALSKTTPFTNRADLVTRLMADPAVNDVSKIKTEREAVIRALADASNTRTWNLLIDMVAQVGRYPRNAAKLEQFVVEGERHLWLHVALDRYTGQIVDQQLELVRE
jgi:hypothetical protein